MVGYVRQSAAEIQTGNIIEAASLNDEYDAIVAFASAITGHNHDGTTGGGAPIPTAGLSGLTNTSSGIMVANGANAFLSRTLTGTVNEITITNGTGVSGNPTFSLPSALTFTGKTITGGTFTSTALTSPSLSSPTLTGTPIIDTIRTSGTSGVVIQNSGGTIVLTVGPSNTTASTFAGTLNINGSEAVTSVSNTQTLTNKTINLTNNTLTGTTAQFNTALSDGDFATLAGTETLTNKTINLTNNTLTGTTAQFNTALSDGDFATLAGTETLTNKTIILNQATAPTPTAEGDIRWDTDDDFIVVGDGVGQKIFRPVQTGTILRTTTMAFNAGGNTTSTSFVNAATTNFSYTPISTNSIIRIEIDASCLIAILASVNTVIECQIHEVTGAATAIGQIARLGAGTATGGVQTEARQRLTAEVSNTALTTRSFNLRHRTSNASAMATSANITCIITEIQA